MSNITPEAKKRYAATASRINREKLQNGEYRRMMVQAKAAEMDIIETAIARAGGSRTQALLKICQDWLQGQTPE